MNIDILIQARMGSTRLPGKSLKMLCGRPLLEWVIDGAAVAKHARKIILCTSDESSDDPIADFVTSKGIALFRGSHLDVLSRFIAAGEMFESDIIVRVCADNLFINGEEIDRLIKEFLEGEYDYGRNHIPVNSNGYPDGLGAEILYLQLMKSYYGACNLEQKEHVTKYVLDNLQKFRIIEPLYSTELTDSDVKLDIDTDDDFVKMEALLSTMLKKKLNIQDAAQIVESYREMGY